MGKARDLTSGQGNPQADLLGYLLEEWEKQDPLPPVGNSVKQFIAFGRRLLTENPAVTVAVVGMGLGVRLANGQVVSIGGQPSGMSDSTGGSVPVSRPAFVPGMHGVTSTESIPVTGKESGG